MLVGIGGVLDLHALVLGCIKIGIDIPAHVEHQRFAGFFRTNQVGGVAKAFKVKLFKNIALVRI